MQKTFFLIVFGIFATTIFGQTSYVKTLKSNLTSYEPKYVEFSNIVTKNDEQVYKQISIENENITLTENAISYVDAFRSLSTENKQNLLKIYHEVLFIKHIEGLDNCPNELALLPLAISGFQQNYEFEGNVGVWGLQYLYAVKFGATITECYDERLDIKTATRVAIKQLEENYQKFGSYEKALITYLFGASNLVRTEKQKLPLSSLYSSNSENIFDIWTALISWAKNYEESNILVSEKPIDYDTVKICERMHIEQISAVLALKKQELQQLNANFKCDVIDGRSIPIVYRLPNSKKEIFLQLRDSIVKFKDSIYFPPAKINEQANSDFAFFDPKLYEQQVYTIKNGDYLGKIAEKFSVKVSDLQEWNNLRGTNITAGKTLIVYTKKSKSTTHTQDKKSVAKKTENAEEKKNFVPPANFKLIDTYTVKSGDNPYSIAKNYKGVSAENILEWNNIPDASKLQIGMKLKIFENK